jgi:hypothetical protein
MIPGSDTSPSAKIAARSVIYSRDPSWRDAVTSFFSHNSWLNTLFERESTPIRKPFSFILTIL